MAHAHAQHAAERRLTVTFLITLAILAAEVAGGLISNSLALLSDAAHVLTDMLALGLSIAALKVSRLPQDDRATYGYHRVAMLAAVLNGLALVVMAAFIFHESYNRLLNPPVVDLRVMLPIAVAGLIGNLLMIFVLGRSHNDDLNVRSAWLHVLGDTLSSVGVIVSGAVMYLTGWRYADPLAGFLIGGVIVMGGMNVLRDAVSIFLDLVPKGFDLERVLDTIRATPGVLGVHDVHMRSMSHGRVSFSAHVYVRDQMLSEAEPIRQAIADGLKGLGIFHTLIQLECVECSNNDRFCTSCAEHAQYTKKFHHHGEGH